MPRLAIIIPWCDALAGFEDTLASVLQNRPKRSEVFVLHSQPYADPYCIADEDVQLVEQAGASELQLINAGLQLVNSPIVHVLRCGMQVEPGWAEPALTCFNDPAVASVVPLVLERSNQDRLVSAGLSFSRGGDRRVCAAGRALRRVESYTRDVLGPSLSAAFYRTDDILSVDGFDESLGPYADIDLALSLRALGQQCVVSAESRLIGSAEPWPAGGFQTGRQLERLFWRHVPRPAGRTRMLLHGWHILTRLLAQLPSPRVLSEAYGRLVGMLEREHYEQFRQRLESVVPRDVQYVAPSCAGSRRKLAA